MAKNTDGVKSGRDASPSRLSQSNLSKIPNLPLKLCLQREFGFTQQIDVTVKPGGLPMKGGKLGSENPAWKGAPGWKIRASRLQQQHKYSSQAASQIPFTQWWSSDRQKSVFFFIPPHLCISGYFYGMCFCGFFGSLWSFSWINPHFQVGLCAGGTWNTSRWPLKWGAERNVGHPAHRTAQPGGSEDLWI